jgi:hypothetical protein
MCLAVPSNHGRKHTHTHTQKNIYFIHYPHSFGWGNVEKMGRGALQKLWARSSQARDLMPRRVPIYATPYYDVKLNVLRQSNVLIS